MRRPTDDPYRRGAIAGAAASGAGAYRAFTPEPEDRAVIRAVDDQPAARVDRYRDEAPAEPALRRGQLVPEDEAEPEPLVVPLPPSSWTRRLRALRRSRMSSPPQCRTKSRSASTTTTTPHTRTRHPYAYTYEADLEERRGGGTSVLAIVALVVLGVAALFGGALLAGMFNGDRAWVA